MNELAKALTVVKSFTRCFFLDTLLVTFVVSSSVTVPECVTIVELDSLNVTCSTERGSDAVVNYEWTRPSNPRFRQEGATLFIQTATAAEVSGNYTCKVFSGESQVGVGTTHVIVQYAPRWTYTTVMKSAGDVGSPGVLTCAVHAEPLPVQFRWTTPNGGSVNGSVTLDGYSMTSSYDNSVLTVDSLQESDYGNYTCIASNVRGTRYFNVSLQRIGPPDSPQECTKISTSGYSVTVDCVAGYDGGRPVTYVVYALPSGEASSPIVRCDVTTADIIFPSEISANGFKLTVGNLKPMRKYDLHLYARNEMGCSSVALYIPVETTAGQTSNVATGFTATIITLLLILLFMAITCNKCRHRIRNQYKFDLSRRLYLNEQTRSRQNLFTENDDLVTNS